MKKIYNRRYMGSKRRILPYIIEKLNITFESFYEPFGGTGIVSFNLIKKFNLKKVYINDILYLNFIIYNALFNKEPYDLEKLNNFLNAFNVNDYSSGYFAENFGNNFFSLKNANKIGGIREEIQHLYDSKKLNFTEYCVLITSLLYSMDKIANTVGHYDAYIINGNLNKDLFLELIEPLNVNVELFISNYDVTKQEILPSVDIVYLDPLYNSRQYGLAYHVLENVSRWNKQETKGITREMDLNDVKSGFSSRNANIEFSKFVQKINAKYIIVSYNDTYKIKQTRSSAIMNSDQIIKILQQRGTVKVLDISVSPFNTGKTINKKIKEKIFVCEVTNNEY